MTLPAADVATLSKAIASALLDSDVADGVTVRDALRRMQENSIRSALRDVYLWRIIAASSGDVNLVELARALADAEASKFEGEGSAIDRPVTDAAPVVVPLPPPVGG